MATATLPSASAHIVPSRVGAPEAMTLGGAAGSGQCSNWFCWSLSGSEISGAGRK